MVAALLTQLVVAPVRESQQRMRATEAVRQAEKRVRAEMAACVPVTPPESALWANRMMAEMWAPYVVPMILAENLGNWTVGAGGPGRRARTGACAPASACVWLCIVCVGGGVGGRV